MLELIRLAVLVDDAVHEAQARSIRRMVEAWDKEIDAYQKALVEENKRHAQQAAQDAALAASLEVYLQGLISQAQSGDDVTVSIPTGIRVASSLASTSNDELAALAEAVQEADDLAPSQRSAAWAVAHGFMPHPADLADILDRRGIDADWSARFGELGHAIDRPGGGNVQQQALAGQQKLGALSEQAKLLEAYGPDRLFRLVADPKSLAPSKKAPPSGTKPGVDAALRLFN